MEGYGKEHSDLGILSVGYVGTHVSKYLRQPEQCQYILPMLRKFQVCGFLHLCMALLYHPVSFPILPYALCKPHPCAGNRPAILHFKVLNPSLLAVLLYCFSCEPVTLNIQHGDPWVYDEEAGKFSRVKECLGDGDLSSYTPRRRPQSMFRKENVAWKCTVTLLTRFSYLLLVTIQKVRATPPVLSSLLCLPLREPTTQSDLCGFTQLSATKTRGGTPSS